MNNILGYSNEEVRKFFLKEESYFNFDLPKYFTFQDIIEKTSKKIDGKLISDFYKNKTNHYPCDFENVNYKFLNNKDGKYDWRLFQLIHPCLYVSLVHRITQKNNWDTIVNRFNEFNSIQNSSCLSIPIESKSELSDKAEIVNKWVQNIEQKSTELALKYEFFLNTDISDCYGSIYTHSIVWALHTKKIGKRDRDDKSLIGNIIDDHLRNMSFGQTNGIPQGSVLMDFIAEMVLGYADLKLSKRLSDIKLGLYEIIRFRDDYRIFTNNPQDAELILKHLTEILIGLGLRLNAHKSFVSNNIIRDSIKPDKLFWISKKNKSNDIKEYLLLIHDLSQSFPNSGSLNKALTKYFDRIRDIKSTNQNILVLISILVDIGFKNPRTYPIISAILSKFLFLIESNQDRKNIVNDVISKFDKLPNTGHIQIWLQRAILKIDKDIKFDETLCKKVNDNNIIIWNSDWLDNGIKQFINSIPIIDEKLIGKISDVIELQEVQLFDTKTPSGGSP